MSLANRIRELRGYAGLSMRELDALAGITSGHTRQIELGLRLNPSIETVRKLAVALGCSLDYLVVGVTDAWGGQAVTSGASR